MEYESDILKRLIDTYGVAGNPRYISEIIKEFIIQGKERFPELFTYQADWLAHIDEFGLNPSYTVSYTGQSIYAPNTLERPVKSAILKGNTLVNLLPNDNFIGSASNRGQEFILTQPLIMNKTYLLIVNVTKDDTIGGWHCRFTDGVNYPTFETSIKGVGLKKIKFTPTINLPTFFPYFELADCNEGRFVSLENMILVEYQVGMENWDIPYFTGMQSVKMPVLTTSNEDGTKTNILTTSEEVELRGIGDVKDELDCLTGEVISNFNIITLDGTEVWSLNSGATTETTLTFATLISDRKELTSIICTNYPVSSSFNTTIENIYGGVSLSVVVKKERLTTTDSTGFRQWLSQNPLKVQYQLATPIVKTVDLTIQNQNGQNVKQLMSFNGGTHFNTGSLEGTPLPSVSVSVETDLEETLKVCSLEGNTM